MNLNIICGTALLIAAVAAISFLAYHGTVAGDAAVAVITSVLSLAGGAFAVHQGVKVGASAASDGASAATETTPAKK